MRGIKRMVTGVVVILVLGLNLTAVGEDVYQDWVARYDSSAAAEVPLAMALNQERNVYVTGYTCKSFSGPEACLTIKYSTSGKMLWSRVFKGLDNRSQRANIAVADGIGNIYICGIAVRKSYALDYLVIKYSAVGDTMWVRMSEGLLDRVFAVVTDEANNLYLAGSSYIAEGDYDFLTAKYSSDGTLLWTRYYDGGGHGIDGAGSISFSDSGSVLVSGTIVDSTGTAYYCTIKYSTNGDILHVVKSQAQIGQITADAVALDFSENLYACWYDLSSLGLDSGAYVTIKFNSGGEALWLRNYYFLGGGSFSSLHLLVDDSGFVYVAGARGTVKYSPTGNTVWISNYPGDAMAIDDNHNVYLTYSAGDYVICKLFPNGDTAWTELYSGPWEPGYAYHQPTAITVDEKGSVYVTGYSPGKSTNFDYATVKYSPCSSASPKAGDANSDDSLSILDVIATFYYIFGKGPHPSPPCDSNLFDCRVYDRICRYDWNGDGRVRLTDCIWAINYVFNKPGGPWNPVPSLGCCPFPLP